MRLTRIFGVIDKFPLRLGNGAILVHGRLSHYDHFPEVADTIKTIFEGQEFLNSYPNNNQEFLQRKSDIISYIQKARLGNIIYTYHNSKMIFLPSGSGKTIFEDSKEELRSQLEGELSMLILKGVHQVIMHLYPTTDNDALSGELLRQSENTLQAYGLIGSDED